MRTTYTMQGLGPGSQTWEFRANIDNVDVYICTSRNHGMCHNLYLRYDGTQPPRVYSTVIFEALAPDYDEEKRSRGGVPTRYHENQRLVLSRHPGGYTFKRDWTTQACELFRLLNGPYSATPADVERLKQVVRVAREDARVTAHLHEHQESACDTTSTSKTR